MTRTERQRRRRRNAWLARGAVTVAGAVALVALVLVLSTPSAAEADGEYIPPEATVPVVPITPETPEPEDDPAEYLAKTIYGEARGCSTTEQAAVVWCVLNRVDDESGLWPDDIVAVVTQPSQFHGYDPDHPVLPELLALAEDVLARWEIEDSWRRGASPGNIPTSPGTGGTTISAQSGTAERPGTGGWKARIRISYEHRPY